MFYKKRFAKSLFIYSRAYKRHICHTSLEKEIIEKLSKKRLPSTA